MIRKKYNNTDVLYLTQSNGRYMSSWLNIMGDDYGIIDFMPHGSLKRIACNPFELNDKSIEKNMKKIQAYET